MKLRLALIAFALSSCAAPQPRGDTQGPPSELVGRTPGRPQQCVLIQRMDSLRVADNNRHTLLYGSGRTVFANNLARECTFGWDDILVTEPVGSQYCRGDIVRSFDRQSKIPGPSCVLSDFIPYTR